MAAGPDRGCGSRRRRSITGSVLADVCGVIVSLFGRASSGPAHADNPPPA